MRNWTAISGRRFALGLALCLAAYPERVTAVTPSPIPTTPEAAIASFLELNATGRLNTDDAARAIQFRSRRPSLPSKTLRLTGLRKFAPDGYIARISDSTPNAEGFHAEGYIELVARNPTGWGIENTGGSDYLYLQATPNKIDATESDYNQARRLRQLRLALSTDEELIAWFRRNRPQLEEARKLWKPNVGGGTFLAGMPTADPFNRYFQAVKPLKEVNYVEYGPFELLVMIASASDEKVFFMYSPVRQLESVNLGDPGWVESLGDDWYFVRQTGVCQNHSQRWYCLAKPVRHGGPSD